MQLRFEGAFAYSTADTGEAEHFFEHVLGLALSAEDSGMRFYALGEGSTLAVDATGREVGQPPYLLFSSDDLTAAAEHFVERGCVVRELHWAAGSGFVARSPEGHTVAVVDAAALEEG